MAQIDRTHQAREAARAVKATLTMLTDDFDVMRPEEIKELLWVARQDTDELIIALEPNVARRGFKLVDAANRWFDEVAGRDDEGPREQLGGHSVVSS